MEQQQQIIVKTEVQPNGDILLFYVGEQEDLDAGNLENDSIQLLCNKYIVEEDMEQGDSAEELDIAQASEQFEDEVWQDEEIKRLIVFYIDNKDAFVTGNTKKVHLWAVACKRMLAGKQPMSCEVKLRSLKRKFAELCVDRQKGIIVNWPYYVLCNRAFHDDPFVQMCLNEPSQDAVPVVLPVTSITNKDGILVVKTMNTNQSKDEKVETMLNLYIKYKNSFQKHNNSQKGLWETITMELGEEDVDYWHKRFYNFKQHYIRIAHKRKENGPESVNWPYMKYFDKIFGDDEEFQKKYFSENNLINYSIKNKNDWNVTENTFLVKYYFDCINEFNDSTIPKKFLWQEVGRLLDKTPDDCQKKFEELKNSHFEKLVHGGYSVADRVPLDILLDNIIASEVHNEIKNPFKKDIDLKTREREELVEYLYENMNMLKDSVCYYVCWAALAKKLKRNVSSCIKEWNELTSLYKSILDDKKENPDMQIDWQYIDLFDRIFDYGMDSNLLDGYEKFRKLANIDKSGTVAVKKIIIKDIEEKGELKYRENEDEEVYDERGFMKRIKKRDGESKGFKILEYYLKNKDKFTSPKNKKVALWEVLARQIGITATECAHRFRNFKQLYMNYVQREIDKPEMPILWPYYNLCKKVFGYRAIKSKLKVGKMDSDDGEDWTAKQIKQLINYYAKNCNSFDKIDNKSNWVTIARELGRSETSCCSKFLELRKSYRKLKTMKTNNPDVKVTWKYFNMLDDIYKVKEYNTVETMDVDNIKRDVHEDEDFQCIIVIPEGEDINNARIIIQDKEDTNVATERRRRVTSWNRRSKTKLLIQYLKYLRAHKGEAINAKEMWTVIAAELDEKTPISCKKMYIKLRDVHKQLIAENSQYKTKYCNLVEKILKFKPFFVKNEKTKLEDNYEDVPMSDDKVLKALNYYKQNLEDFVSPKFEQKYLWTELAKFICEPVNKIYSKINFLKQTCYKLDNPYKELVSEILTMENALKESSEKEQKLVEDDENETWSDIETERLLTWYLAHLDKFKNPKFVRSYLWMEASDILKKSALVCSKKMLEIRSLYRAMVRENPEELDNWKFYNLCQRIYGTGKKSV